MLLRLVFVLMFTLPAPAMAHEGVEGVSYIAHLITHTHHILPVVFIGIGVILVYIAIHPLVKDAFTKKRKDSTPE